MEKYLHISPVYFTWRFWGGGVAWSNFPFLMKGVIKDEETVADIIIQQTLTEYSSEKLGSCKNFEVKVHSMAIPEEELQEYAKRISFEITKKLAATRNTPAAA